MSAVEQQGRALSAAAIDGVGEKCIAVLKQMRAISTTHRMVNRCGVHCPGSCMSVAYHRLSHAAHILSDDPCNRCVASSSSGKHFAHGRRSNRNERCMNALRCIAEPDAVGAGPCRLGRRTTWRASWPLSARTWMTRPRRRCKRSRGRRSRRAWCWRPPPGIRAWRRRCWTRCVALVILTLPRWQDDVLRWIWRR